MKNYEIYFHFFISRINDEIHLNIIQFQFIMSYKRFHFIILCLKVLLINKSVQYFKARIVF